MGESRVNLTHHFLIAMPSMADPHFAHTLIYVCEHNEKGALGIVINKPIDMTLSSLFEQIQVPLGDSDSAAPLRQSGPDDRGFVHRPLILAICWRRRPGPYDIEGHPRSRRSAAAGCTGLARLRWLTRPVEQKSRRMPGLPSRRIPT
jgi:hypothetical protein